VPIILSSDKTELCVFTNDKTAYPLYLTIGNIDSHLRRQSSKRAYVLIAYLPTAKLDKHRLQSGAQSNARQRIFHACLHIIFRSLRKAAKDGIKLKDSEGFIRLCFTILAIYIADYPEQSLVTLTRCGTRCPKCWTGKEEFGENVKGDPRKPEETLHYIDEATELTTIAASDAFLKDVGLNCVPKPFWRDWPHANIHNAISSDVLHQLYQGLIKYLTKWCKTLIGEDELDARFRRLPLAHGLRHFENGISHLQRVSGTEHKAIAKQLLACVDGAPPDAIRAAAALLNFTYIAQYSSHSDETLEDLQIALDEFHKHKQAFIDAEACQGTYLSNRSKFRPLISSTGMDFPKLHSLQHYIDCIKQFGAPDGFNTENTENLHIPYAKEAWRASNKREALQQMCTWLERREKLHLFGAYHAWRHDTAYDSRKRPPSIQTHLAIEYAKWPTVPSCPTERLKKNQKATHFDEALTKFLEKYCKEQWAAKRMGRNIPSDFVIPPIPLVNVWYRMKFYTPDLQIEDAPDTLDIAHAEPARKSAASGTSLKSRFDAVLVEEGRDGYAGRAGLEGIRVAQLRVIFEIPLLFQNAIFDLLEIPTPGKLAYVEWFTRPKEIEAPNGLPVVSHLYKQGTSVRRTAVIEAVDIRRTCHLIPKLGRRSAPEGIPRHLTSTNVLERWKEFWLNKYVDKAAYRTMFVE